MSRRSFYEEDATLIVPPDGERVEMSGSGAIVSRRQADGSWRIVLDNPISPEDG